MNLIICTTPLQVKIATQIINMRSNEIFYKVYLTRELNNVQNYYSAEFDKIIETKNSCYVNEIDYIKGSYDTIFYASFDNHLILEIVTQSKYKHLMSFDDGFASVYAYGMYTTKVLDTPIKRILIDSTEKHYTIYKSKFHVVDKNKVEYLPNVFKFPDRINKNGKKLTLMLGQILLNDYEMSSKFINEYSKKLNIDRYIPHPKESFVRKLPQMNSHLLIEDLVPELMNDYQYLDVYHFYSSAAIHLNGLPNIDVIGISILPLRKYQEELKKMGCKYQDIYIDWN